MDVAEARDVAALRDLAERIHATSGRL